MSEVLPETLEQYDITPACDRTCATPAPPAEFVARFHMPCGCEFILLICAQCLVKLNWPTYWLCPLKHVALGRASDWCTIEALKR